MRYSDFALKIEPSADADDSYTVIVLDSPAGQGRSTLRLPFQPDQLGVILGGMGRVVRSSRSKSVTSEAPTQMTPYEVGDQLFGALFQGHVRTLYDRSLGRIEGQSERGLRIKLHFDPMESGLAQVTSLPWEFLYQSETRDFLNLNRMTPIVRYLDVPRPSQPLAFAPPLRILVVVSSPRGVEPLDLDRERANIETAWGRHSSVEVEFLESATTSELRRTLLSKVFHVLHFMGHGDFDERSGQGVLVMEDDAGADDLISGQALATMLRSVRSLRLVFLNACDTARATSKDGVDPFAGVATALVMGGLPAVLAMQFPISDQAAIAFSEVFYPRLAAGDPVDAAVAEGRLAIYLESTETLEWGTPVLFMRTPDGRLFERGGRADAAAPTSAAQTKAPTAREPESARAEEDVSALYTQALSFFYTEQWDRAIELLETVVSIREDHSEAASKLEQARRMRELSAKYEAGRLALDSSSWVEAESNFAAAVDIDSSFRDVAALLEQARHQGALAERYEEAQRLHKAEQWPAVLAVFERIHELDEDYPDPDELFDSAGTAHAAEMREAEIDEAYVQAVRYMDAAQWEAAVERLEHVDREEPGFRETSQLLKRARTEREAIEMQARLSARYERALAHVDSGAWAEAEELFEALIKEEPDYEQAMPLLRRVRKEIAVEMSAIPAQSRSQPDRGRLGAQLASVSPTVAAVALTAVAWLVGITLYSALLVDWVVVTVSNESAITVLGLSLAATAASIVCSGVALRRLIPSSTWIDAAVVTAGWVFAAAIGWFIGSAIGMIFGALIGVIVGVGTMTVWLQRMKSGD